MPTTSDILALALVEDADTRQVLGDVLCETGWWDARLGEPRLWTYTGNVGFQFFAFHGEFCQRAIAAVLLFGDWSTEMWPVVQRCKRPPIRLQYSTIWIDGVEYSDTIWSGR